MRRVFVYGSLMHPTIAEHVIGRPVQTRRALLPGFRRHRVIGLGAVAVRGIDHPTVVPARGCLVMGRCLQVSQEEMQRLDIYEGDEYELTAGNVQLLSRDEYFSEPVNAVFYRLAAPDRHTIAPEDWDYAAYVKRVLREFV